MKKVYCIVVSYNGVRWIDKCLQSLVDSSHPVQVLVIDNGSTDLTLPAVKKFSSVQLIETGKNLGFGQANNIGLKIALDNNADYVFLLNQDAWVEQTTIEELVHAMSNDPSLGIVSPVHLSGSGKTLDTNFSRYLMQSDAAGFLASAILNKDNGSSIVATHFVNAAAWLVSAACLKRTGGFDPIFFHYGEDRNYTQRALHNGFRIGIYIQTRIYHDREQRAQPALTLQKKLYDERIHFLNQVCNPAQRGYKKIITRRFLRYTLLSAKNLLLLNLPEWKFNYGMAKMIISSASNVRKSRQISISGHSEAHLPTTGQIKNISESLMFRRGPEPGLAFNASLGEHGKHGMHG